jgi:hypothetical protein
MAESQRSQEELGEELARTLRNAEHSVTRVQATACLAYARELVPPCSAETLHTSGAASAVARLKDTHSSDVREHAKTLSRLMKHQVSQPSRRGILVKKSQRVRSKPKHRLDAALAQIENAVQCLDSSAAQDGAQRITSAASSLNPAFLHDVNAGPRLKALLYNASTSAERDAASAALAALRNAVEQHVGLESKLERQRRRAHERRKLTEHNLRRNQKLKERNAELQKYVSLIPMRNVPLFGLREMIGLDCRKREQEKKRQKNKWLQEIRSKKRYSPKQENDELSSTAQPRLEQHSDRQHEGVSSRRRSEGLDEGKADDDDSNSDDGLDDDGQAALAELRKITGYDPSRFGDTGEVEVANYRDIQHEERESKRFADEEDRQALKELQAEERPVKSRKA